MKEPHIIELPQLQFTGVDRSYEELQSQENGFCILWTEIFPKHRPEISPMSKEDIPYGVYRMKDWPTADRFCAALKTEGGGAVAQNCARYNIPPQRYAFFQQAPNYICAIADSLAEAITKVGFEIPEDSVCFETDAPSVAGQDQSVDIWIPVRQRNNG